MKNTIGMRIIKMIEEEYEDDADFAYRNGEYDNEVDEYGN